MSFGHLPLVRKVTAQQQTLVGDGTEIPRVKKKFLRNEFLLPGIKNGFAENFHLCLQRNVEVIHDFFIFAISAFSGPHCVFHSWLLLYCSHLSLSQSEVQVPAK